MTPAARNEAFWDALHAKDWTAAQVHLDAGADIHMRTTSGDPLLIWAYRRPGSPWDIIEWLRDRGADFNALGNTGYALLHLAARIEEPGYENHLRRLIGYGATVDLPSAKGTTALMEAVLRPRNQEPGVKLLLSMGAQPNLRTASGASALSMASGRDMGEVTDLLLAAGAQVSSATDDAGENILHAAASGHKDEVLVHLLETTNPHPSIVRQKNRQGVTPLMRALAHGMVYGVEALLQKGADVHDQSVGMGGNGFNALMLGAVRGHPELIDLALRLGADPNARDEDGLSVLAYAVHQGVIADKLEKMNLGARDGGEAAAKAREEAKKKAKEKPDLNKFNVELLRQLVDAGADPTQPLDRGGMSPWLLTLEMTDPERQKAVWAELDLMGFPLTPDRFSGDHVLKTWKDDGKRFLSPLSAALLRRNMPALNAFLTYGGVPDQVGPDGRTALHLLSEVSWSQEEILALRVMGARLRKIKDDTKRDEAQAKVAEQEKEMINFVIDAAKLFDEFGANWNVFDKNGYTPIHSMVAAGRQDILEALSSRWNMSCTSRDGDNLVVTALVNAQAPLVHGLLDLAREAGLPPDHILAAVFSSPESHLVRPGFLATLRTLNDPAALNHQDADGNTPLIVATATGQQDVVAVLLELGADPNLTNQAGESAMLHAVQGGRGDIIRALRKAGASTTQATHNGETPLQRAVVLGEKHVLDALNTPDVAAIDLPVWTDETRAEAEKMRAEGLAFAQRLRSALAVAPPAPSSMRM